MSTSTTIEISERHLNTVYLNGLDFLQVQNTTTDSEFQDDKMELVPLTPQYSETSLYSFNDDILESSLPHLNPTKIRYAVIIISSIVFFFQTFSQSVWNPIFEQTLEAFPYWTSKSLALLPIWGSVMSVILVFPACMVINKYGLKNSLLWSCSIFTIGTLVRCLPIMYYSPAYLHLSAAFLSAGSVFMSPLMITISTQWFPKNERNMAIAVGSAGGMLGSAATYIIGPTFVLTDGPPNPELIRNKIMMMLYACSATCISSTTMVFLFFPKHVQPVSYTSKISMLSHRSGDLINSFKELIIHRQMWYVLMAFALSYSISSPWSAIIPATFSKLHVPRELSVQCGLYLILHNFLLSLSMSAFADKFPGYSKEIVLCSRLVSLASLFWLMVMMNFRDHGKLSSIAFPYSWCNSSLLYEMGTNLMFPMAESYVGGYMTLMNNFFVDCVYLLLYAFPKFDEYWIHFGVFFCSLLSIIFLLLTPNITKETYLYLASLEQMLKYW
ncbi:solute carrier family 49 member 4-like isoform X2 [Daktulosphaira vitifoliae]|uniref:solute carrier family 49 member 4-like isoform X2 n=1 Tax=Daktulosphaira vitifoliae TaxID=58002 RepID=UPI0021AA12B0|nr:solute carrier family 49 member 4-like isoform X2 [Daktulosphaira vitifoliae]